MDARCKTCRWWVIDREHRIPFHLWPRDENYEAVMPSWETRVCTSPKLEFYAAPGTPSGAVVFDGSQYMAELATGEDFGCVNHEERPADV